MAKLLYQRSTKGTNKRKREREAAIISTAIIKLEDTEERNVLKNETGGDLIEEIKTSDKESKLLSESSILKNNPANIPVNKTNIEIFMPFFICTSSLTSLNIMRIGQGL